MRIAIGGIMHESNTFAGTLTNRARFEEGSLTRGEAMLPVWKDAHHEMGGFIAAASAFEYDLHPTAMAWATPGGPVCDAFLDAFVDELLTEFRKAPCEGMLLALHGAMVTTHHPSADTEVLRRIRESLGPELPIAVTLDFHANCTPEMANHANLLIGYQTYPHVDQRSRGILAAELLTYTISREIDPVSVVVKRPMMINLLGQATDREPMRSLLAQARVMEKHEDMLSMSLMAGFPYADVPTVGASVIAVADGNRLLAEAMANELAEQMWSVREELNAPCLTPAEAVAEALRAEVGPVVLVDLGDNIGGGSAGDSTVLLAELLRQRATGSIVVLYAPAAVKVAQAVGVGKYFFGTVGGCHDQLHGEPIRVAGLVQSLHPGKWEELEPRHGGLRSNDQGPTAVISMAGANTLVLNSLRTPPFSLGQLTSLGIDVRAARVIVVKAAVAYKAAYGPIASRIIEVDTPGMTAIDPNRFRYQRIPRPMFPLDR